MAPICIRSASLVARRGLALGTALLLLACAGKGPYVIDLMPAPDVYDDDVINPLAGANPMSDAPYRGILFATDRAPAREGEDENYFANERSLVVRVGMASIRLSGINLTWEEARKISLAKTRSDKYPLQVKGVEEYGILQNVQPYGEWTDPALVAASPAADERFAGLIDAKLAVSKRKDVYIYVHGYKVAFENPVLVGAELWHFLGYDGVLLAYAWPSTPKTSAYFKDIEQAALSGGTLRMLIEYLAEHTDAEQIHILGYSAGTRVVITALHQLALARPKATAETIRKELRVGNVALVGSDYDTWMFGKATADGLLKVPSMLNVYTSDADKALGMSRLMLGRRRLGQLISEEAYSDTGRRYLLNSKNLFLIDVSAAESYDAGNGHAYFRKSPWASSDVLMTMMYDLRPKERGLVRNPGGVNWEFPDDYISRLRGAIIASNPEMKDALEARPATARAAGDAEGAGD